MSESIQIVLQLIASVLAGYLGGLWAYNRSSNLQQQKDIQHLIDMEDVMSHATQTQIFKTE